MTADKMATQAIAEAQGGLEVDGPTSLCLGSQGCSFEGFLADISAKSISAEFRHGEADPIDGNAVAECQGSKRCASLDHKAAGPPLQPTDGLNQSCEHVSLACAVASGHNRIGPKHRHG
jgi:hypothetical protein